MDKESYIDTDCSGYFGNYLFKSDYKLTLMHSMQYFLLDGTTSLIKMIQWHVERLERQLGRDIYMQGFIIHSHWNGRFLNLKTVKSFTNYMFGIVIG